MTTVLANQNHWTFSRQDLIPQEPDSLWRLERGVVRTRTWSEEGTLRAKGYWGPGDVVGQPLSRLNPYQIECSTCVEASIVPQHLWHQVVDAMVRHVQQTEKLRGIIHHDPIHLRLQQFLIWLAQKFGRDVDLGELIDLQLTHQEIAEAISTTRVTVTRNQDLVDRPLNTTVECRDKSKEPRVVVSTRSYVFRRVTRLLNQLEHSGIIRCPRRKIKTKWTSL